MVLALNLVLSALVVAMVVMPLARAIAKSRPQSAGSSDRRQTARVSAPAASRMRAPALGASGR